MENKSGAFRTIIQLAKNDIKARYANSFLGIIWAFVMPLITILVFWYVFQMGFKNLPVGNAPYILWFSAAYIPWVFFSDIIISGSGSLIEYSFLVKKIKFNVEAIPIIKLVSSAFVHLFFIVFLIVMFGVYEYGFNLCNLQIIYYTLATAVYGLGLVWLLSASAVFFKDTISIVNVCIQIGFWITPILWNEESMVDENVAKVLSLNPMHYIINGYRDSLIFNKWFWENGSDTLYFWTITIIIFIMGVLVFRRLKPFFADEV